MPNATAVILTALALTTNTLPACKTMPVLSQTPLANTSESNSRYSDAVGVPDAATAILTNVDVAALLQRLTVTTAKVVAGTV